MQTFLNAIPLATEKMIATCTHHWTDETEQLSDVRCY